MLPSRKFVILLCLGFAPAALAALVPEMLALAVLYVVVCGALLAGEWFLGVRSTDLEVRRVVKPRLSLDEDERVEITVRNFSRRTVRVQLTDTFPVGWEPKGLPLSAVLSPEEETTLAYQVVPTSRGRFQFSEIYARVEHFPGLAVRQFVYPAAEEVRVYPDMQEVNRYELMARRSRLNELGVHRSRVAGRGTEFERIRDYTPDDEYRQIDWKATARRHRPMSRVYEVERSQNVFLVIDAGRMMAGKVGRLSKVDYAVNAALMVAHVALRAGDKVGLMIVSDEVHAYLPLGKGQGQFSRCMELLYAVEARLCHVDYRAAMEEIAIRCKRRSLVVFFTDLVDEETSHELVTYMRLLRPVHLPLCVTLQDAGVVNVARQSPATVPAMYERTVALELLDERQRVLDRLARMGAVVLDTPPQDLSVNVVNRYLELKYRGVL